MRRRAATLACSIVLGACGGSGSAPTEITLEELRRQVAGVRASVEARLATEAIMRGTGMQQTDVALRLATPLLVDTVSRATESYLEQVTLDLRPDAVVREGADVRVAVGPVRVRAGRWELQVTIRRIQARLRAGSPELGVAGQRGENRLELVLPVEALEGSGTADIDFHWDAARAVAAVCRDFRVQETFSATVSPRTYELAGGLALRASADGRVRVEPDFDQRLLVQPEPTAESWRRVRELLERQDRLFRCGLALDPADMEARLGELLRRGFRFGLPASLLRPILVPGGAAESATVAGRRLRMVASTAGLRLAPDWLWYGLDLEVGSGEPDAP